MEYQEIMQELQKIKQATLLSGKAVITLPEFATLAGVSESYAYKLVHRKEVPHYKRNGGKLLYFSKKEVEDWMLENRVPTDDEVESAAATHVATKNKRRK